MKPLFFPDYESLSLAAATQIFNLICAAPELSICLATGSTPTRTYENLCELSKHEQACFPELHVIKLDEWGGLARNHPATCENYLHKHIIEPLQISSDHYLSFRADAEDSAQECSRVRLELERLKPIDLCVLGLGINGHLGFNEPAGMLSPYVHVAELTEQTQQHPMVESNAIKPKYGYTLGMADLLQAKRIMLLVSGSHKTSQLKRLLSGKIETSFPASFLWLHPDVEIYSDIE